MKRYESFYDFLRRTVGARWVLARRCPRLVREGYEHFLSHARYAALWNEWALGNDWTRASDLELEHEVFSPLGREGLVPVRHELARRWLAAATWQEMGGRAARRAEEEGRIGS